MRKILIFFPFFLLGCSEQQSVQEGYDWILTADPESDANVAAKSGDKTLIGISGMFGSEIPVADGYKCAKPQDIRYLKIDDVIDSYAEQKYNALAEIYAGTYNTHLRKYFNARGQDICNS
jgi:hypothetical protein